jgi:hypothetical protein
MAHSPHIALAVPLRTGVGRCGVGLAQNCILPIGNLRYPLGGSQSASYGNKNALAAADNLVIPLSTSFIASFCSGNVLKFQLTGTAGTALTPGTGSGTTKPSFSFTILRLQ